jgi:hypothetical protein
VYLVPTWRAEVEDEVGYEEEGHPYGIDNENPLGRPVQDQAERNLHDAEQGDAPPRPLMNGAPQRPRACDAADEPAAEQLQDKEHEYCGADSVVRVREAPLGSNSEVTRHEDGEEEQTGEDVELRMELDG